MFKGKVYYFKWNDGTITMKKFDDPIDAESFVLERNEENDEDCQIIQHGLVGSKFSIESIKEHLYGITRY